MVSRPIGNIPCASCGRRALEHTDEEIERCCARYKERSKIPWMSHDERCGCQDCRDYRF